MKGHCNHHNLGPRPFYTTEAGRQDCRGAQRYFFFTYGVPLHFQVKHSIDLVPSAPLPNGPIYRCSLLENEEIKHQIHELIQKGHIQSSSSPCGSPIVLVQKKVPYVQHSYNRSLHNSIGHNPFQVCLGFQPLAPIDVALPTASSLTKSSHTQTKANHATKFVEWIQHLQQHRFMTSFKRLIPSTSNNMTNIRFHTSFRLVIRCGCTCRKSASQAPQEAKTTLIWALHHHKGCG
jgi:hypothetical protein